MTKDFHKKKLHNPFYRKKEIKRYWTILAIVLAVIFLISATIYIIYLSPLFLIKNIDTPNPELKLFLEEKLLNKNLLVLKTNNLSQELISKYQLNGANIKKIFPKTLKVDIIEREVFFLLKIDDHFEFRDEQACKVSNQNPMNTDSFPIISIKNLNLDNLADCISVEADILSSLSNLYILSISKNIEIAYFEIEAGNSNFNLYLKGDAQVYFSLREDLDKQFHKFEQIYKEKIDDLQLISYIDVRYGDRAFINYK